MPTGPVIHFRDLQPSPAIEALVRKRAARLDRLGDGVIGCEVILDAPGPARHHGREVRVRLCVGVPGPDLSVERVVIRGDVQEALRMAVNRAFSAMEEQLKQRAERLDVTDVKPHPPHLHGSVTELERELGYGVLKADDGREVYFQRDVLNDDDWARLGLGMRLRFRERIGDKGPYATAVSIAG